MVEVLVALAAVRAAGGVVHLLDDAEHARHVATPHRDAAVTVHALLRLLLAATTGRPASAHPLTRTCVVCGGPHGRARCGAWHVSVARTPDLVAAAVAGVPVGVDVELDRRTGFAGFDGVVLGPGEHVTPAGRGRTWARKEAVLKADGRGLTVDPRGVLLGSPDQPPVVLRWPGGPVWLADVASPPGSAVAVAVLGESAPVVRLRDGDALLSAAVAATAAR